MQPDSVVVVVAVVVVVVSFNSRLICVYLTGIVRAKTKKQKNKNKNKNKNRHTNYSFLVQSPKEAELLGLEWGHTSSKQHNIF